MADFSVGTDGKMIDVEVDGKLTFKEALRLRDQLNQALIIRRDAPFASALRERAAILHIFERDWTEAQRARLKVLDKRLDRRAQVISSPDLDLMKACRKITNANK